MTHAKHPLLGAWPGPVYILRCKEDSMSVEVAPFAMTEYEPAVIHGGPADHLGLAVLTARAINLAKTL